MSGGILVLGATGLLGHAVAAELAARARAFLAPARAELDLAALDRLPARLAALAPGIIINLAGFTDVVAAEDPANHEAVRRLNAVLPATLAAAAVRLEARLVHISTDYVFDGAKTAPYLEEDAPHPLQVYGRTKLEGERAVLDRCPEALVLRVSTLFGPGRPQRPAYVDAILSQAVPLRLTEGAIHVVEGPVACPTYAPDAASALVDLLDRGATGVVHVVNQGACSRLELARWTVAACHLADRVTVVAKPAPPSSLRRPAYAVLHTGRLEQLLGRGLPHWRDAVTRYIEALRASRERS